MVHTPPLTITVEATSVAPVADLLNGIRPLMDTLDREFPYCEEHHTRNCGRDHAPAGIVSPDFGQRARAALAAYDALMRYLSGASSQAG